MTFGEKLKALIRKEALTLPEFAEIIGSSPSTCKSWIVAKHMPNHLSPDDLYVISRVFGVDMEYFLTDDIDDKVSVALITKRYVLMRREGDVHE